MLRFVLCVLACSPVVALTEVKAHRVSSLPPDDTPTATINLDLPPKERWVKLAKANPYAVEKMVELCPAMRQELSGDADEWVKHHNFPSEYVEELQGIVEALPDVKHLTLDCLILLNAFYDLQIPVPGTLMCSGILAAMPDGTVVHGRNSDFPNPHNVWHQGLYKVTFMRDGKPLYVSAHTFPGVGLHTGMRFDGWTFQQNTRTVDISEKIDLAAAKRGGMSAFIGARRIMEEVPDFGTAVSRFAGEKWMSSQYWIMAGKGPYEGAVVTVDKMPEDGRTPMGNVETLNPYNRWYLAQTNTDRWREVNPYNAATLVTAEVGSEADARFDQATNALSHLQQSEVSEEWVTSLMQTPPLYAGPQANIYYVDMVPAKNTFHMVLPANFLNVTRHTSLSLLSRRRS